jgi:hypothetical protein
MILLVRRDRSPGGAIARSSEMIYSKFQSRLAPISKTQDASGRITIQATTDNSSDVFEYLVSDLKADEGLPEINALVEKLPWKVFKKQESRRRSAL